MKNNLIIACIVLMVIMFGCVRPPVNNQITYIGQDTPGTIKMRVTGFGIKQTEIEENAQIRAFEQLLYVGLPDASQAEVRNNDFRLPLIENKTKVQGLPGLKKFFEQEEYKQFVMNISPLDNIKKKASDNQRTIPFSISINYDAFRRYMEQNQVIRKFGY